MGKQFNYSYANGGIPIPAGTDEANDRTDNDDDNYSSYALSAYWEPIDKHWVPSVSGGFGWDYIREDEDAYRHLVNSWSVGLEWDDVLNEGNSAGIALGQTPYIVSTDEPNKFDMDWNYATEFWYKIKVSDHMAITPAILLFIWREFWRNIC